jgi:hypothetical protein
MQGKMQGSAGSPDERDSEILFCANNLTRNGTECVMGLRQPQLWGFGGATVIRRGA